MSDLEKRDVEGLQETHRLVVKALAAEREKVRVLREDLAYAINFMGDTLADDTFKKGFVRRQADRFRQTLAATEPGKTDA